MSYRPQFSSKGKEESELVNVEDTVKPAFLSNIKNVPDPTDRIKKAILDSFGQIKDFWRIDVKPLYTDRYRVNVLTQSYAKQEDLFPVIHHSFSYFVKDLDGVFNFDPPLPERKAAQP